MAYVELHAASAFSFLEGASIPEALVGVCVGLGMPAMALLDANCVYGSPRFHLAAKKSGVRAHIGAELNVSRFAFRVSRREQLETRNSKLETPRLPLLCASRAGYQNLCRLITRMKMRGPK